MVIFPKCVALSVDISLVEVHLSEKLWPSGILKITLVKDFTLKKCAQYGDRRAGPMRF